VQVCISTIAESTTKDTTHSACVRDRRNILQDSWRGATAAIFELRLACFLNT